jgi:hypothetical protein
MNKTPLHCERQISQKGSLDHLFATRHPINPISTERSNLFIKITVVFTADIGEPTEGFHRCRRHPLQGRNDFVPDSVPQIDRLIIAGIVTKRQRLTLKVGEDLSPPNLVQGPNDDAITACRHAGKTG